MKKVSMKWLWLWPVHACTVDHRVPFYFSKKWCCQEFHLFVHFHIMSLSCNKTLKARSVSFLCLQYAIAPNVNTNCANKLTKRPVLFCYLVGRDLEPKYWSTMYKKIIFWIKKKLDRTLMFLKKKMVYTLLIWNSQIYVAVLNCIRYPI